MSYLPPAHANQTALAADDHTQYHTDARGDALYPLKAGTGASGTWPIDVTGTAASAPNADNAGSSGNADFAMCWQRGYPPYGFHLHWADNGVQSYIFQSDDNANNYVIHENTFSRSGHNHNDRYGSKWGYNHVDVGTMAAATAYGPWVWGHGLGIGPRTVMPTPTYDDNTHSCVGSIGNLWDATNVAITGRNSGAAAEAVAMGFIAWG
jgi:hypothetical protein